MKYYNYDIETFPNCFTLAVERFSDSAQWVFEISFRRDDSAQLWAFLQALHNTPDVWMVGFNNIGFDYVVVHEFVKSQGTCGYHELYAKSQSIFNTTDRFGLTVWPSDWYVPQLDLYKINHFDNKARSTSLKQIEFNMRIPNIADLPYPPGTHLNGDQIDVLIDYNLNGDVVNTREFFKECLPAIKERHELTARFNRDFMNHSDAKIGKDYFIMRLEQAGIPCFTKQPGQGKQPIQTKRPTINLNDAVFPYIQFNRPEFQMIHQWLKSQVINKTKGVFEFIEVSPEMAKVMNPNLIKVYGLESKPVLMSHCYDTLNKLSNWNTLKFVSGWKDKSGLNCIIDGFRFDFGTGGIHGSVESQTVHSDDEWIIEDWDVKSYYPKLAIANRVFPAHLAEVFCDIYEDLYNERSQYSKKEFMNKVLKLALNAVYGDSNSQYSPFYDSLYTMTVTINGQLLLCMLAEQLMNLIPNLKMIQINTDGLTVRYPRRAKSDVHAICEWWESFTKLELEDVEYSRMMIKDVNNYIGEYTDGELKRKGAYEYERQHHQNHSAMIVPKIAEQALVHGVNIEDAVRSHTDMMDFCLFVKTGQNERLLLDEVQQQRRSRYYVSQQGGTLIVVRPPPKGKRIGDYKKAAGVTDAVYTASNLTGVHLPAIHTKNEAVYGESRSEVEKDWKVTVCNDIMHAMTPINYDYYIERVKKLVEPLR